MKFVSIRDFRNNSGQIWEQLNREKEVILTVNGQPNALLVPLSDETLESTIKAIRQAKAIEAVHKIQSQSAPMSMDDIDAEIRAARNERVSL